MPFSCKDRGEMGGLQQGDVTDASVGTASNLNALLHAEIAREEALGGQALRIELHIADHSLQLTAPRHGADEGHLGEEGRQAVVGFIAEEGA